MKGVRLILVSGFFLAASVVWLVPSKAADADPPASVEERRLRVDIQQELAQIRAKAENLRLKEIELKTLQEEVDKKLAELNKVRDQVTTLLARKDEEENKKIRELSKMYEKMEPAKAAEVLIALDENLAIGILGGIKSKTAGKILNSMEKAQAARLSTEYSTLGLME